MKPLNFNLRRLIILILSCVSGACLTSYIVANRKSARQQVGLGIQADPAHWPYVLRNLIEKNDKLRDGLLTCGLNTGLDQSSIWRLEPDAPMIEYLKHQAGLEATGHQHPKASLLISQLPSDWPQQNWTKSLWYATPGFGTQHIEGPDLYLLAVDSITGHAIVLHECHF